MRNTIKAVSITLATVALSISSAAQAEFLIHDAPSTTIDSCVNEIGRHADYSDAERVRHTLKKTDRRSLAYELKFSTEVYGDNNANLIRTYKAKCVVYGSEKPIHFEIKEIAKGA